jgi:hypothetical protein
MQKVNFLKRKILEDYMLEAVVETVGGSLSARALASTPGFGVTVGA